MPGQYKSAQAKLKETSNYEPVAEDTILLPNTRENSNEDGSSRTGLPNPDEPITVRDVEKGFPSKRQMALNNLKDQKKISLSKQQSSDKLTNKSALSQHSANTMQ